MTTRLSANALPTDCFERGRVLINSVAVSRNGIVLQVSRCGVIVSLIT